MWTRIARLFIFSSLSDVRLLRANSVFVSVFISFPSSFSFSQFISIRIPNELAVIRLTAAEQKLNDPEVWSVINQIRL